ncbi:MAG TPA: hypothetical protein VMV92_27315 [Streptosporangiaceae bacterium]|nr:hypothetical protein [Streptosporangiaceae bacterium]
MVDEGIAAGSTTRAACQVARAHGAARVVPAVPVAPPGWEAGFEGEADELVCVDTPEGFDAIGQFHAGFSQVADDEVIACLERAATPVSPAQASTAPAADPPTGAEEVEASTGLVRLAGYLTVPENAPGIVVFAHGSGSPRLPGAPGAADLWPCRSGQRIRDHARGGAPGGHPPIRRAHRAPRQISR